MQKKDAAGTRAQIGTIVTPGQNMIFYPYGCNGDLSQTIVHQTALHRTALVPSQSSPIVWDGQGLILQSGEVAEVAGICVIQAPKGQPGGGFGQFAVPLPPSSLNPTCP